MQATLFLLRKPCTRGGLGIGRGVARVRLSTLPIRAGIVAGGLPEKTV